MWILVDIAFCDEAHVARYLVMWTCDRNEVKEVQKRLQELAEYNL
jgi:hypothetical protein